MGALSRSETSDCSNPVLDIWLAVAGILTNVHELSYQIFDYTTGTAIQVYPATPGDRALVNIAEDCPDGQRLSTGHYVALWTVPGAENIGTHRIRWYFRLLSGSPEQQFYQEFEIVEATAGVVSGAYCTVADIRAEGVPADQYSDNHVLDRILTASRYIDRVTGRWFEARSLELILDGNGGVDLLLDVPIIALEKVEYRYGGAWSLIETSDVAVYNRHISCRLLAPDDRDNPKLAYRYPSARWRYGRQNHRVTGIFGYTDPVLGSSTGEIPRLIRQACILLTLRGMAFRAGGGTGAGGSCGTDPQAWRLKSEKTRDQSYDLDSLAMQGGYTGDPEIDQILAMFVQPMTIGSSGGW